MNGSPTLLLIWVLAAWLPISAGFSIWKAFRAAKAKPVKPSRADSLLAAVPSLGRVFFSYILYYMLPIAGFTRRAESAASWLLLSAGVSAAVSVAAAWKWPIIAPEKRRSAVFAAGGDAAVLAASLFFSVWVFSVPGPAREELRAELPFRGEWLCASGGRWSWMNRHHGDPPAQDCAADFIKTGPGNASFGQPVFCPVEGTIEGARNDQPDDEGSPAEGNFISIRTKSGALVTLAHFKQGSVKVREGDAVIPGGKIAECGYSGSANVPHLHIHAERDGRPVPIVYQNGTLKRGGIPLRRRGIFPVRGDIIRAAQKE